MMYIGFQCNNSGHNEAIVLHWRVEIAEVDSIYTHPDHGKLNSGLPTAIKTIIPDSTPEIAALAFVRTPLKAATEKRVTPKGTILQVGEKPPSAVCQIVFIGASHTQ
jgi:hypothetical protein